MKLTKKDFRIKELNDCFTIEQGHKEFVSEQYKGGAYKTVWKEVQVLNMLNLPIEGHCFSTIEEAKKYIEEVLIENEPTYHYLSDE